MSPQTCLLAQPILYTIIALPCFALVIVLQVRRLVFSLPIRLRYSTLRAYQRRAVSLLMPVRDHIQIETQSFAPGILPESARTFRIVSCLRIVTGADIPLCFFCRITAAFYNDLDQPVWSRRVLLYKIIPRIRRRISATSPGSSCLSSFDKHLKVLFTDQNDRDSRLYR